MRARISNTRPPRLVTHGFLSCVVRTGASLCLLILYYAVASQSEGVVGMHTVAFRMLVDFVCVLPPKQVQTQSFSVGVLVVLVAKVQNA